MFVKSSNIQAVYYLSCTRRYISNFKQKKYFFLHILPHYKHLTLLLYICTITEPTLIHYQLKSVFYLDCLCSYLMSLLQTLTLHLVVMSPLGSEVLNTSFFSDDLDSFDQLWSDILYNIPQLVLDVLGHVFWG